MRPDMCLCKKLTSVIEITPQLSLLPPFLGQCQRLFSRILSRSQPWLCAAPAWCRIKFRSLEVHKNHCSSCCHGLPSYCAWFTGLAFIAFVNIWSERNERNQLLGVHVVLQFVLICPEQLSDVCDRIHIYGVVIYTNHTINRAAFVCLSVCLSVCLFPISSEVLWPIFAKLGGCM